jgi:signal transduction histidine kinase
METVALINQQRRRMRWVRWFWAGGVFLLYCGWDFTVDDGLVLSAPLPWHHLVSWSLLGIVVLLFTLFVGQHWDRQLAAFERLSGQHQTTRLDLEALHVTHVIARTTGHYLNQPLAIIRGLAELLLHAPPTERTDHDLRVIIEQVDRAAQLVRQLMALTNYQPIPAPSGELMLDLHSAGDAGRDIGRQSG